MTSLAVELNYSNLNAQRARRHTTINREEEDINNKNINSNSNYNNNNNNNNFINSNNNNNNTISHTNNLNTSNSNYQHNHHNRYINNAVIGSMSSSNSSPLGNSTSSAIQYQSTKMPSSNIIYKLKTGNTIVNNNQLNESRYLDIF